MQNRLSSGARLGRQALLFPLCLVLYEFSTYIGNDMIQPGMLAVVEQYNAGLDWVPKTMNNKSQTNTKPKISKVIRDFLSIKLQSFAMFFF